jgi:hypothetical protein
MTVIAGLVPAIHGGVGHRVKSVRIAYALRSTLIAPWITATRAVMTIMGYCGWLNVVVQFAPAFAGVTGGGCAKPSPTSSLWDVARDDTCPRLAGVVLAGWISGVLPFLAVSPRAVKRYFPMQRN